MFKINCHQIACYFGGKDIKDIYKHYVIDEL